MKWTTAEVRTTFLKYFESKGHAIVPSAPIVIKNDPTLMFTNAGMNQFKSIFVGNEQAQHPRVADTQKCLRVSGKHNDLEEVGLDHYHHTMFEMLGNWSFGDYFKSEAIDFAWDLLVNVYGIDKDRIYVSIFGGDESMGLERDEEAFNIWKKHVAEDRILAFGRKDNFWEMGDTGPCGPCSEIHVDLRSIDERKSHDGRLLVNNDHPEVIEIWNLVFMQFNRLENGSLQPLKDKHIDTGMGLERLVRVLQGVHSNYDTDVFRQLIESIESASGMKYTGGSAPSDIAFRVIADHVRAVGFCIADGQLPSNTGAGYVVRRVLRRAIRYGFSRLNMNEPFIYKVAERLTQLMGDEFRELEREKSLLSRVVFEEEQSFLSTLDKGLHRLNAIFDGQSSGTVKGELAFELYDTFGFPIDLTGLIAGEQGWDVDMEGFNKALREQKDRSRNASKTSFGDWTVLMEGENSVFLGYDQLECTTRIAKYRTAVVKGKETAQIVLAETPYYAESGGQVGDSGTLSVGTETVNVLDTKKENNEFVHFVDRLPSDLTCEVHASVNAARREEIKKNHSATHLLHHVLRDHLGTHVEQKGSLVDEDRLRFDFSHFEKISPEQLKSIEDDVRKMVGADIPLDEWRAMPIEEAREMGAMALFGEKYDDRVRVVKFGPSVELCGGTHVSKTSEIEGFKIIAEGGVSSGVRRMEVITGKAFKQFVEEKIREHEEISLALGKPKDLVAAVSRLTADLKSAQKQIEELREQQKAQLGRDLTQKIEKGDAFRFLIQEVSGVDGKALKDLVYGLTLESDDLLVILVGSFEDKPFVIVGISKALVEKAGLDAIAMVRSLAPFIDGGGGGQKFLAMAGGKNKQGLKRALEHADEIIRIQTS